MLRGMSFTRKLAIRRMLCQVQVPKIDSCSFVLFIYIYVKLRWQLIKEKFKKILQVHLLLLYFLSMCIYLKYFN